MAFRLKSGNKVPFKQMGSSPINQEKKNWKEKVFNVKNLRRVKNLAPALVAQDLAFNLAERAWEGGIGRTIRGWFTTDKPTKPPPLTPKEKEEWTKKVKDAEGKTVEGGHRFLPHQ